MTAAATAAAAAARPVLRTLGTLQLLARHSDGREEVVQGSGKPLALLAYLVVAGGRPVSRALLADLLWGDEAAETARASLRQALHVLRRLLGDEVIVADRVEVAIQTAALESDYAEFEAALEREDVETLLTIYRGPFFGETTLRASNAFERWMDAERDRLRRRLLDLVERALTSRAAAGALAAAAALGRAVYRAEPELERAVLLCADALVADGGFDEARAMLESHQVGRAAVGESASAVVAGRLARLAKGARRSGGVAMGEALAVQAVGQAFVGRDFAMAALFRALDRARSGGTLRLVLTGPPGIGKTRVLDEFESRLRPRGARLARVRLLPAMREIPGAALAEIARALCPLPAAAGVTAETAATLVEMLPELQERYPGATPVAAASEDLMRRRVAALKDLVAAVSEDRLSILLVDDAHNSDAVSMAALEHALDQQLRLLVVLTSRNSAVAAAEQVPLPPLTADEVRELLESLADLPEEPWSDALVRALALGSAGVPQLLSLRLRALRDHGALDIEQDSWRLLGAAEEAERIAAAPFELAGLLDNLSAAGMRALRALALWREALPEEVLRGLTVESDNGGRAHRGTMEELELRGLIVYRSEGWLMSHDTIAEVVLARMARSEAEELATLLIRRQAAPGLTPPMLERLALVAGAPALREAAILLIRLASRDRGLRAIGISRHALARRVAEASGHPEWERALFSSIAWTQRLSRPTLVAMGALSSTALLVLGWLTFMLWPRLVVETMPMMDGDGSTLVVQPRVAVYDGFGRLQSDYPGQITVRGTGRRTVYGDTVVTLANGVAQFERLSVDNTDGFGNHVVPPAGMEFRGDGLALSARADVLGSGAIIDAFEPVRIVVNGVELGQDRVARVRAGDSIHVALTFRYSTMHTTANYLVGAAATWLPRERSTVRLTGLPRPVADARHTSYFALPPAPAGRFYVPVLFDMEDTVEHLFSLSSWSGGVPSWYDGTDVADMTEAQFDSLRTTGYVWVQRNLAAYAGMQSQWMVQGQRTFRPMPASGSTTLPFRLTGTAILVEVRPR